MKSINTNATTAFAGVGTSHKDISRSMLLSSTSTETDTSISNGSYSAINASIPPVAQVTHHPNPINTRPTAKLAASYDVERNQRFSVTGIYHQDAYQAKASTTVIAAFTVGF